MSSSDQAVLLLSGGLDSVAALHFAKPRYARLRAIGFDYGQPHRDCELPVAGRVAGDLGVSYFVIAIADAMRTHLGFMRGVTDHDQRMGLNPAFVPGRNAVFLSLAAAHACAWFATGNVDIVIGACRDDATGFADCRATFLIAMAAALRLGCAREMNIVAPYVDRSKSQILLTLESDAARADVSRSWSCYRSGEAPCARCSACVARAAAFEAARLVDRSARIPMRGGDRPCV